MEFDQPPPPPKPRTTATRLVVAALVGMGLFVATCYFFAAFLITIVDTGSPQLASEWKVTLAPLDDLDSARKAYPGIAGKRFDNGEWAFGFCHDSHKQMRFTSQGGTLVVKDSRGATRVFFGHVCGREFLQGQLNRAKSLDDFYDRCLAEWKFEEYLGP
jgi:hypothetical protein